MLADFFAGLPNEGEAINAPAARQLMKSKRLVFMNISSYFDSLVRAVPKHSESPRPACPELSLGTRATYPCFVDASCRGCVVNTQLLLVNRPPSEVSSLDKMMKCVVAVLCSAATWQAAYAAQPEHSTSPSRQFVIYGADAKVRGAISGLAEKTKTDLLGLLRQRDDWKTPVVVNLQSQQSNLPELPPADLRFSQTGFGIKLQLDLTISKNFDVSLVKRELLRAILLEMVYRNQPHITAGALLVEPPDWLIDGALALAPGRDRGPLIEALGNPEKRLPLEKFLRQRPGFLDSTGRTLYRAYAFALVQMLLDGKNGGAQLAKYIGHLYDSSNDP